MAVFTQEQTDKIIEIVTSVHEGKNLKWKIIQQIPSPELIEKDTLYFRQVSISPKKFELYHSDKDGDLANHSTIKSLVTSPDATDLSSAITLLNELKTKFNSI